MRLDRPSAGEQSLYDTFDQRLHRAGMSLVHARGRLTLVDGGCCELAGVDAQKAPERMLARDLPPGRLRALLSPVVEVRALMRLARVRSIRQSARVLDGEGKTVVRLAVERPAAGSRAEGKLSSRLSAIAVRGYEKELARVCRLLEADLGLIAANDSLQDEALARSGRAPAGMSSSRPLEVDPGDPATRAAARVALRQLEVIEVNLPGVLADIDCEFLHDVRVAVRRTRSLQRQLRQVFPSEPLARFRADFRWLQAVTGPTRDLDVCLLGLDDLCALLEERQRRDLAPLPRLLERRRDRERRMMVRALRSQRAAMLLRDWGEFLSGLEVDGGVRGDEAERPIVRVAGERIATVYRRMVKAGFAIDPHTPPEPLHALRKDGKELRYLLEFFATLYPVEVTKPMVRALKALQETLGLFQDRQVQAELLRSLGQDVTELQDKAAALIAMGQLVARLEQQQEDARAHFAERFQAFAARKQRTLVRETFTWRG
jgi:CHAD domain-containing protein